MEEVITFTKQNPQQFSRTFNQSWKIEGFSTIEQFCRGPELKGKITKIIKR